MQMFDFTNSYCNGYERREDVADMECEHKSNARLLDPNGQGYEIINEGAAVEG